MTCFCGCRFHYDDDDDYILQEKSFTQTLNCVPQSLSITLNVATLPIEFSSLYKLTLAFLFIGYKKRIKTLQKKKKSFFGSNSQPIADLALWCANLALWTLFYSAVALETSDAAPQEVLLSVLCSRSQRRGALPRHCDTPESFTRK